MKGTRKRKNSGMNDSFSSALSYAIILLSYRARSSAELERRLLKRGYDRETAFSVIMHLREKQLIDDEKMARDVAFYLLEHKRYGVERIRMELNKRGIDRNLVDKVTGELMDDIDWKKHAISALRKRFKEGIHGLKERKKAFEYLLRRGFDIDVINYAIKNFDV